MKEGGVVDFLGKAFALFLRPLGGVCFLHSLLLYIQKGHIEFSFSMCPNTVILILNCWLR